MRIKPVEHKYGKPKPYPVNFGILKYYRETPDSKYMRGIYKDKRIEIFDAKNLNKS